MYAFIEVTSLSTGRKIMLNLDHIISLSKTDSGLADIHTNQTVFTTHETYDQLVSDLKEARVGWSKK